jgi:hypothetical protein
MLLLQTSSVSQEWDNINDCVLEYKWEQVFIKVMLRVDSQG